MDNTYERPLGIITFQCGGYGKGIAFFFILWLVKVLKKKKKKLQPTSRIIKFWIYLGDTPEGSLHFRMFIHSQFTSLWHFIIQALIGLNKGGSRGNDVDIEGSRTASNCVRIMWIWKAGTLLLTPCIRNDRQLDHLYYTRELTGPSSEQCISAIQMSKN